MNKMIFLNGCPVRLGNPLKVATSAWERWGIGYHSNAEFQILVDRSEACYATEWQDTDECCLQDIAVAAERAGLSDCNNRLNEGIAEEVAKFADCLPEVPHVIDIGSGTGNSTLRVIEKLISVKSRIRVCLIEPNKTALEQGKVKLHDSNFSNQIDLYSYNSPDIRLAQLFPSPIFDLAISGAALHHHAYLDPAVVNISSILKPGGFFVVGDWHNSMWLDPGRVYTFLQSLDWENKSIQLGAYAKNFQTEPLPEEDSLLQKANEQICSFWRAYADVKSSGLPPYEILEGHRPPNDYRIIFEKAGLRLFQQSRMLLDQSDLLCVHVAQK
jgi:SAM-dependent methyltransferase